MAATVRRRPPHASCPHRPAAGVAGQGAGGERFLYLPVLREALALAPCAGVTVTVCPLVGLEEGGVEGLAHPRLRPRGPPGHPRAADPPGVHLHAPSLLSGFMDGGASRSSGGTPPGRGPWAARACPRTGRHPLGAIGALRSAGVDRPGTRSLVIEGQQPAARALRAVLDHLLDVLRRPLAWPPAPYQPGLGSQRYLIPIVALPGVGRIRRLTGLRFVPDKGPLVGALPRARPRGKSAPLVGQGATVFGTKFARSFLFSYIARL